jgi:hypothetical protein
LPRPSLSPENNDEKFIIGRYARLTASSIASIAQQTFNSGLDDGRRFLWLFEPGHDFCHGWYLLLLIFVILLVSRVSLRQLFSSLKALWIMIIILLLINVLVPPLGASRIAFSVGTYHIFWESILQSAKIILRLVMMISLTLILTATTKPLDLTYALEWYMYPLKLVKFPTHEIAMTISIALRLFRPPRRDDAHHECPGSRVSISNMAKSKKKSRLSCP